MSENLCVFCEHMQFSDGGGGEYADPSEMRCTEGHWLGKKMAARKGMWDEKLRDSAVTLYSMDDFRQVILLAKDCKDYSPPKDKP